MLNLPDVTLVAVDTACHELTRFAVEECLKHAKFAEVLLFSDKPILAGATHIPCQIANSAEAEEFMWYGFAPHVKTSHFLIVQWDSWILDPSMWRDDFLAYDYIGAPWWYKDGLNVGNGGFSLRSKRLAEILLNNKAEFPFKTPEDDTLCRVHRPTLEAKYGVKWPSEDIAYAFAFECTRPAADSRHFGFHAMQNWPVVLTLPQMGHRMSFFNEYICRRPALIVMLASLLAQNCPGYSIKLERI